MGSYLTPTSLSLGDWCAYASISSCLQKDISSRKLYITPHEIVYKVTRPSFLPFLGVKKNQKRIPLHLVIAVVVEQGCLQAVYGIHTFRVESKASRKAAQVDELQFQGVSSPYLLRKIIVVEAAKNAQEFRKGMYVGDGEVTPNCAGYGANMSPLPVNRYPSPRAKILPAPQLALDDGSTIYDELLLHKIVDMRKSVKKIESLLGGSEDVGRAD